ncbi:twin-arginine translocase subunit TatC [Sediminispirochaeta bajacaliforniensis]|uniref:twin-arginine translocase subunit TatC n=1 Tax=Sediminispirochaeta bajacaliforniensis TaxID=148 RepID=UPI000399AB46|nr:twin-arginine translocase subunit TatC [Sediminispirochaeta bajacaliforniensis]
MSNDLRMTFFEHLSELRKRLFYIAISIVLFSGIGYYFVDPAVEVLKKPVQGLTFVYLTPPELFLAYIKISVTMGIMASVPVILFQIWRFVKPGLEKGEVAALGFTIIFGTIFFITGAFFSYRIILPITMTFFLKYSTPEITAMFSFGNYIGFISSILIAFGVAFELPIVVVILARVGLVNHKKLQQAAKYILLGIVVMAAILTPPDVVSQILLAGPMFVLYELSVLLAMIFEKRKQKEETLAETHA